MIQTRVLILAAGNGARWNNYNGVPKHKVVVEDEVLIERTARQFLKYTDDVVIVAKDQSYKIDGCSLYIPKLNKKYKDMDKFMSSKNLWSDTKTVLVFGDVYFTNEAVDTIMTNEKEYCFFLRKRGSKITGKNKEEIFAISFYAKNNNLMLLTIKDIISQNLPFSAGGWLLLKNLFNMDIGWRHRNANRYINIDDWTDDFDYPEDFDNWTRNRIFAIIDLSP